MYNGIDPVTDGITAGVEARKERGKQIANFAFIRWEKGYFIVPSQSAPRPTTYKVTLSGEAFTCECQDHEIRRCRCKHVYAVEFFLDGGHNTDGRDESVAKQFPVKYTRKTYPQNWPAYNAAQTTEKHEFQSLLYDLCKDLPTPEQPGRGQRRIAMPDAVFSAVFKVYCTLSARRFTSDLCDAQAKGYIDRVPHFNSVLNYLENPNLYSVLLSMIEQASLPLRSVESTFAVDSTGFAYSRFARWYDAKYNRFTSEQQWIKAHLCCGVKTNVVTAIEIHERDAGDAPQLPSLVQSTARNFTMREVCADKGYSSRDCHEAIEKVSATPYIVFKANATGNVGGLFGKMFHFYQFNRDEFLSHYHQRSNIESTVMAIKTKFGDAVRSKTEPAAKNEVLAKVLCHNVCCLIQSIHELGINVDFCTTKQRSAQREALK